MSKVIKYCALDRHLRDMVPCPDTGKRNTIANGFMKYWDGKITDQQLDEILLKAGYCIDKFQDFLA